MTTINCKVTNKNDFVIHDRYDGVPFAFEPKKAVTIPADAALHIFGWTPDCNLDACKMHTCRRMGWNTPEHMTSGIGAKYFKNVSLEKVTYRSVEIVENESGVMEIPTKGGPKMPLEGSPAH